MEPSITDDIDRSIIEYSDRLHLSVIRHTECPAILSMDMATDTFTRDLKDSEKNQSHNMLLTQLMATGTFTEVKGEPTDSDREKTYLRHLMATETFTKSSTEQSDADR